jgi:hypothetical protein
MSNLFDLQISSDDEWDQKLKKKSDEQSIIDASRHFLFSALDSLSAGNFDDYLELMDSYNLECKTLDDMSVEAGCDHWYEYSFQYMWLYYLHAIATYMNTTYLIFTDQYDERDIHSADGMIFILLEQAIDFLKKVPLQYETDRESVKNFFLINQKIFMSHLWNYHKRKQGTT